ncbi:ABC transporter substrate-binding protein [Achromobacter spanius]|uniref:ABC transporter permease n=1 Tax=Achromobacter spanius TaxID=217203 RepID=A0A2S0IBT2_9BURK|nr:ABC transporter substrate-binding protein [Achromobacter spanius]AVJ29227.1 ABC transporter permease [Achromobacter spanius]
MKTRLHLARLGGAWLLGLCAIAPAAAQPVKIGLLSDMGGTFSALGGAGSCAAAKMAAEDFGGKVLDRPIEILCADHQNKVEIAASLARKWMDHEGVTALADIASSAAALAIQQAATESKKAVVLTSASGTESLVNSARSPVGAVWAWNTRSQAMSTVKGAMKEGGKKWFFITVDYTFGHALERDASKYVVANGGTVVGKVRHPLNTTDFSSYLLQAQASGADVVALATGGADLVTAIKQAQEFGLTRGKQKVVSFITFLTDIHALGLQRAQGLVLTTSFYWDLNDETRAWAKRFFGVRKAMPTMVQASVYSSVGHYLKAVQAAGSTDAMTVMQKMREIPVNDVFTHNGKLREDGVMLHDMLVAQVKTPQESKAPWDYYKILSTLPADQVYWPLSDSECPLVKK